MKGGEKGKRITRMNVADHLSLSLDRQALRSAELRGERRTLLKIAKQLYQIEKMRGRLTHKQAVDMYAYGLEAAADRIRRVRPRS